MENRCYRAAWVIALLLFLGTRTLLHTGLTPYFDSDTYKYIGGADALWHGQPLPPLFNNLEVTGGALHAVPGYTWFITLIWTIYGGITLIGVNVVQSVVAFIGFGAAADLARRFAGRWSGLALFSALTVAPSHAWLEHTVMPDALATPLLLVTIWLAIVVPPDRRRPGTTLVGALAAGVTMGLQILLRTASQVYIPIPIALALLSRSGTRPLALWSAAYLVAMMLPLAPWIAHNHDVHGVYRLTASTGRNMYFSALWTNTVDRAERARELGMHRAPTVLSSFTISDLTFQDLLRRGHSIPEADAAMKRMSLDAYLTKHPSELAKERLPLLYGLFVRFPGAGVTLRPIRPNIDHYLANLAYKPSLRAWMEKRFKHKLSQDFITVMNSSKTSSPVAVRLISAWVAAFTFDGLALLLAYLICLTAMCFGRGFTWTMICAFGVAPLLFMAVFIIVGAPLYRYQVALHPFMMATVVLAVSGWRLYALREAPGITR